MATSPHSAPLEFAEHAARIFADGKKEEAGAIFAQVVTPDTTDLRILFLAYQFHFRSGNLDEAERLVRRRLALAAPDTEDFARASTNLGLVYFFRKDLDNAELHFGKAVEISRRNNNAESLARDIGNYALVPEARGDLDTAEALFREGLALAQSCGAEKIVAGKLANLGDIALARAKPDQARDLWTRALEMFDRLGITMWRADLTQKLASLDGPAPKDPRTP